MAKQRQNASIMQVFPYDLESWQVNAIREYKLRGVVVPIRWLDEHGLRINKIDEVSSSGLRYNDSFLLGLRESHIPGGGGSGDYVPIVYQADGGAINLWTQTPYREKEFFPQNSMHPLNVRFFMGPLWFPPRSVKPEEILDKPPNLGLEFFPRDGGLKDKLVCWWKARYKTELSSEPDICVFDGHILMSDYLHNYWAKKT